MFPSPGPIEIAMGKYPLKPRISLNAQQPELLFECNGSGHATNYLWELGKVKFFLSWNKSNGYRVPLIQFGEGLISLMPREQGTRLI